MIILVSLYTKFSVTLYFQNKNGRNIFLKSHRMKKRMSQPRLQVNYTGTELILY